MLGGGWGLRWVVKLVKLLSMLWVPYNGTSSRTKRRLRRFFYCGIKPKTKVENVLINNKLYIAIWGESCGCRWWCDGDRGLKTNRTSYRGIQVCCCWVDWFQFLKVWRNQNYLALGSLTVYYIQALYSICGSSEVCVSVYIRVCVGVSWWMDHAGRTHKRSHDAKICYYYYIVWLFVNRDWLIQKVHFITIRAHN